MVTNGHCVNTVIESNSGLVKQVFIFLTFGLQSLEIIFQFPSFHVN